MEGVTMENEKKIAIKNRKIKELYENSGMNMEKIYDQTQEDLERYEIAVWLERLISGKYDENYNEYASYCAGNLRKSISSWDGILLQEMIEKKENEENELQLYLEKGMKEKIDTALEKVMSFPKYGFIYGAIIHALYVSEKGEKQEDIMQRLKISSAATYTNRRKEAVFRNG